MAFKDQKTWYLEASAFVLSSHMKAFSLPTGTTLR